MSFTHLPISSLRLGALDWSYFGRSLPFFIVQAFGISLEDEAWRWLRVRYNVDLDATTDARRDTREDVKAQEEISEEVEEAKLLGQKTESNLNPLVAPRPTVTNEPPQLQPRHTIAPTLLRVLGHLWTLTFLALTWPLFVRWGFRVGTERSLVFPGGVRWSLIERAFAHSSALRSQGSSVLTSEVHLG